MHRHLLAGWRLSGDPIGSTRGWSSTADILEAFCSCSLCNPTKLAYLRQTAAGLFLRDVALGDILLERREQGLEQRIMLTEQARLCNATWVQRRERHTR